MYEKLELGAYEKEQKVLHKQDLDIGGFISH